MPSSEVMHKWKHGTLHSGSASGPKVKSRSQAIAIMMSEKRNEAKHGGHYVAGGRPHGSGVFTNAEIRDGYKCVEYAYPHPDSKDPF